MDLIPVEKREPSYTVGGNVNWCSYYGKQYGSSLKKLKIGDFLTVQWLRLRASTAGGAGLIPGQGTKIPHAMQSKKEKKKAKTKNRATI